ncbi:MAG TPA: protein kinase, partial [Mycobacteriales bacterium]|nr:protein kinase [Mycobacteriales bacterium]
MSGTRPDRSARTVPLEQGEIVGEGPDSRWRVVRHVADGGFSSVYEVRPATPETVDRHGGAPRALKCVWGTPAELTAINSEAARTQDVDGHPGVLTLVTSFRFERATAPHHHVGLVLELADEDLPTFGARVRPSERAWAAVFEQVAAGLAHIHQRRVVHGDIKPTNILRIDARFAVADFGVSAPLESTRSAGIGLARTIAFWPPESATQGVLQADGVRRPPVEGWRASQAGDVWALAVSAHRMLTGRHITAGTTPEQQYELVCLGRYAVDGRIGPGWRRLLEDCLIQDPRRRRVTTSAQLRERLAELAAPP